MTSHTFSWLDFSPDSLSMSWINKNLSRIHGMQLNSVCINYISDIILV